jgi:hypothetical protein
MAPGCSTTWCRSAISASRSSCSPLVLGCCCSSEPHAARAGGAGGDAEPAHGLVDGHQSRPDQHADLRPRLRHRRDRGRGHRAVRKVTSELGSNYIVQSFMTVVVGGVGNIWGTLAGAGMIGSLQKVIEFLNPSNTLAAQTYMILFIILFIQFRPRASSRSRAARRGIEADGTLPSSCATLGADLHRPAGAVHHRGHAAVGRPSGTALSRPASSRRSARRCACA